MRAGTYPARGYATLELSGLELSFTGAYTTTCLYIIAYAPFSHDGWLTSTGQASAPIQRICCLAGTCVLDKQSFEKRLLQPRRSAADHLAKLTVNFFAEFLEPPLPVCLSLLDLLTCVGYRYGYKYFFVHVLFLEAHVWRLDYTLRWNLTLGPPFTSRDAKVSTWTPIYGALPSLLRQTQRRNEILIVTEY